MHVSLEPNTTNSRSALKTDNNGVLPSGSAGKANGDFKTTVQNLAFREEDSLKLIPENQLKAREVKPPEALAKEDEGVLGSGPINCLDAGLSS